jgi:type IV pilus assembly protein PilC
VFSRQFATMINSGLSLLRALTILGEQTSNRRLGEVIIQSGPRSRRAPRCRPPLLGTQDLQPPVRVHGPGRRDRRFLDQVLVKVAETFEKEVELRGKIRSAMTYPVSCPSWSSGSSLPC